MCELPTTIIYSYQYLPSLTLNNWELIVFRKINNPIVQFTFQSREFANLQKDKEELMHFKNNASAKFLFTLKIGSDIDE